MKKTHLIFEDFLENNKDSNIFNTNRYVSRLLATIISDATKLTDYNTSDNNIEKALTFSSYALLIYAFLNKNDINKINRTAIYGLAPLMGLYSAYITTASINAKTSGKKYESIGLKSFLKKGAYFSMTLIIMKIIDRVISKSKLTDKILKALDSITMPEIIKNRFKDSICVTIPYLTSYLTSFLISLVLLYFFYKKRYNELTPSEYTKEVLKSNLFIIEGISGLLIILKRIIENEENKESILEEFVFKAFNNIINKIPASIDLKIDESENIKKIKLQKVKEKDLFEISKSFNINNETSKNYKLSFMFNDNMILINDEDNIYNQRLATILTNAIEEIRKKIFEMFNKNLFDIFVKKVYLFTLENKKDNECYLTNAGISKDGSIYIFLVANKLCDDEKMLKVFKGLLAHEIAHKILKHDATTLKLNYYLTSNLVEPLFRSKKVMISVLTVVYYLTVLMSRQTEIEADVFASEIAGDSIIETLKSLKKFITINNIEEKKMTLHGDIDYRIKIVENYYKNITNNINNSNT